MIKRSQLVNCLGNGTDTLDPKKQIKYIYFKIGQRFMVYVAILTIIISLLLGIALKKSLKASFNYLNTIDY